MVCCNSLITLNISLSFKNVLWCIYTVDHFEFILFVNHWVCRICMSLFINKFMQFSVCISFFLFFFFVALYLSFPSRDPIMCKLLSFMMAYMSLKLFLSSPSFLLLLLGQDNYNWFFFNFAHSFFFPAHTCCPGF